MIKKLVKSASMSAAFATFLAPQWAHAHTGLGVGHDLAHGLLHPLTGLDHLCAMVAVGLWAAQRGGPNVWALPIMFIGMLTAGAAWGIAGAPLPYVEPGIALSVLVLGLLVAAAARLSLPIALAVVGVFAVLHGHAHGAEIPAGVSGLQYAVGFIVATAALHAVGITVATAAARRGGSRVAATRVAGGAIAICGLFLCVMR